MEPRDQRGQKQRKTHAQYRAHLAAQVAQMRRQMADDEFFAATAVGFRIRASPCKRCGLPRALNEAAAYGDRCEVCWCVVFVTKKDEGRKPVITRPRRTLRESV